MKHPRKDNIGEVTEIVITILKMSLRLTLQLFRRQLSTSNKIHRNASGFKASDLTVDITSRPGIKPEDPEKCLFGKHFTDHMFLVEWTRSSGWGVPQIKPLQNLSIHPGTSCLHYAIQLFEGMKAYRTVDNRIAMFRPEHNMDRMLRTAKRAALPEFDKQELLKCISELIRVDSEWVPDSTKASLYIRPTFISMEPTLGVNIPHSALLYTLLCPVGPYFETGSFQPVKLMADPKYVRAFPGGVGAYKLGSNYGPTINVQEEAQRRGCQQVLWLYGEDHQVTEVGTMNLFVYWINEQGEKELITMPLDTGIILPGVTRTSLLDLAHEWNDFKTTEGRFTMGDVTKALNENRVIEMFGAGTACVVCPVDKILYMDEELHIPTMDTGAELSKRFLDVLTDIQYGRIEHDWSYTVMDLSEEARSTVKM